MRISATDQCAKTPEAASGDHAHIPKASSTTVTYWTHGKEDTVRRAIVMPMYRIQDSARIYLFQTDGN